MERGHLKNTNKVFVFKKGNLNIQIIGIKNQIKK